MLPTAFKEQSKKWESITLAHVSNAILVVHHFIHGVVKESCNDDQVFDALWSSILENLIGRYQAAMDQAKLLIHVEREGRSITYNPAFDRALNKIKAARSAKNFENLKVSLNLEHAPADYVRYEDLKKQVTHEKGISATSCVIHDVLQSYYEVASARFSDMICAQVVDYFLLGAEDGPLNVLSANRIFKMTAEQLEMVAGEDVLSKSPREILKNDIMLFEQGKKVLRT